MYLFFAVLFLCFICFFTNNFKFKLNPFDMTTDKSKLQKTLMIDYDNYIDGFTKYDYQTKLKTLNTTLHTKKNYIVKCLENIQKWSKQETQQLEKSFHKIMSELKKTGLYDTWIRTMPPVYVVKSSMEHEGGAIGYTFRNYIFMKNMDYDLLTHELFHVFTRYNPVKQQDMYRLLGFKIADKLRVPDTVKDLIISNPDTHRKVYTTVSATKNVKYIVTPLIYGRNFKTQKTINESFFKNMQKSLLVVTLRNRENEIVLTPKYNEFIDFKDHPEYTSKLHQNTNYDLHPEEVLADNFSFIMNDTWKTKENPELPKQMIEIMT